MVKNIRLCLVESLSAHLVPNYLPIFVFAVVIVQSCRYREDSRHLYRVCGPMDSSVL